MSSERPLIRAAVHVLLTRQLDGRTEILMLRRAGTGYQDGNWSLPAGHLDGGETMFQAAAREAQEEIGIALDPELLSFAHAMHRASVVERLDFFVIAPVWSGEPVNTEPHKASELAWFPTGALPRNTIPYVRYAIEDIARGRPFSLFGWPDGDQFLPTPDAA